MNQTKPLKSAALHTAANLLIILGIFRPTGSFCVNQVIVYYVVVRQKTKTIQSKLYSTSSVFWDRFVCTWTQHIFGVQW